MFRVKILSAKLELESKVYLYFDICTYTSSWRVHFVYKCHYVGANLVNAMHVYSAT